MTGGADSLGWNLACKVCKLKVRKQWLQSHVHYHLLQHSTQITISPIRFIWAGHPSREFPSHHSLPSGIFHEWSETTQTREIYPPQHWHLVAKLPLNTRPTSHHPHIRSAAALGKKFNAEQISSEVGNSCYLLYYLFRPSCWGWTITAQVVLWIHD